ncbi:MULTISPECIES: transposase [Nocardia]|uniref:transposase n=1 Tax=Nocardia TaxID=1817 RepID=UPI0024570222|nr:MULTISPECIES: transposase [Nocardia]
MPAHHNATSKQTNTDRKADQAQHLAGSVVLLEGCPHASSQARLFTVEYKVEAAHRVIDSGRASTEVARELGVHETVLSTWVKDERRRIAAAEVHGEKPLDTAERAELLRLRRQVGELEKDNAFLVNLRRTLPRRRRTDPVRSDGQDAGPDDIAETAGTIQPEGQRFSIRRMARLLSVSASGYQTYVKRKTATSPT